MGQGEGEGGRGGGDGFSTTPSGAPGGGGYTAGSPRLKLEGEPQEEEHLLRRLSGGGACSVVRVKAWLCT